MDQRLFPYLDEMRRQCQIALMAIRDLDVALGWRPVVEHIDPAAIDENTIRRWYALQAFLSASANVSKLLWPDPRGDAQRGKDLRDILAVPDSSPLAPPRILRNHFEHLDERLDRWAQTSQHKNLLFRSFGHPGAFVGLDLEDYVAYYDTSNHTVTFLGDPQPITPLLQALQELYKVVDLEWQTHIVGGRPSSVTENNESSMKPTD